MIWVGRQQWQASNAFAGLAWDCTRCHRESLNLRCESMLQALFNKGNLHRQCNEFADAVECYENVLQLDSSHWRSLLNKAVAEIGLGRQDAARHSLQAAYKLSGMPAVLLGICPATTIGFGSRYWSCSHSMHDVYSCLDSLMRAIPDRDLMILLGQVRFTDKNTTLSTMLCKVFLQ